MHMANDNPISEARKILGLSQTEMAREMGVSQSTVWRWERGKLRISPLAKLAIELLLNAKKKTGGRAA
jgi:transcriptional regulator with XRE-family HTH domain